MKLFKYLLPSVVLSLALASCGGGNNEESPIPTMSATPTATSKPASTPKTTGAAGDMKDAADSLGDAVEEGADAVGEGINAVGDTVKGES